MMQDDYRAIHEDPLFRELERQRRAFSWWLTAVVLAAYFSFILVVAFAPELLARPMREGSAISWGIPAGLLLIVLSFLLTGVYVHRANSTYDPMIRRLLDNQQRESSDAGG